jgi:hypothetical protein
MHAITSPQAVPANNKRHARAVHERPVRKSQAAREGPLWRPNGNRLCEKYRCRLVELVEIRSNSISQTIAEPGPPKI